MSAPAAYIVPSEKALAAVLEQLRGTFDLVERGPAPCRRTYVDTFDEQLAAADLVLYAVGEPRSTSVLARRSDEAIRVQADEPPPRLSREAHDPALRSALTDVTTLRAFLPLLELRTRLRTIELHDGEKHRGDVLLLGDVCVRLPDSELDSRVSDVVLLRPSGRRKHLRTAYAALAQLPAAGCDLLDLLLEAAGYRRPRLTLPSLAPDERADEAVRRILRALFEVMQANEGGLRAAHDTEFLHDYRVALRRTRSVLGQLSRVFPPEPHDRYREDFRWLATATGPARDLDVFLLGLAAYRERLSPSFAASLDPLRAFLESRRRDLQTSLVQALDTERYARLRTDWQTDLTSASLGTGPLGERTIREVVSARIRSLYRRAVRDGERLGRRPAPEAVHRLRIDCKKLRYLIELFASIYDHHGQDRIVRRLKRLQDVLGDHHDYAVQQAALQAYAGEMDEDDHRPPAMTFLAMGRLMADLEARERRALADVEAVLAAFVSSKMQHRIEALSG